MRKRGEHPGFTLQRIINSRCETISSVSLATGISTERLTLLTAGDCEMTEADAEAISRWSYFPKDFWMSWREEYKSVRQSRDRVSIIEGGIIIFVVVAVLVLAVYASAILISRSI